MDFTSPPVDKPDLRLSESPALSPKLVDAPESRVRSVHLETMEDSMQEPVDPGLRTTDFFDDNSSDEEIQQTATEADAANQDKKKNTSYLGSTNTSDFISNCGQTKRQAPPRPPHPSVDFAAFNANGYVNPQQLTSSDRPFSEASEGIAPDEQYLPDHPGIGHNVADRLSTALEAQGQGAAIPDLSSTKEQILSLHAMSLQALMRTDDDPQSHFDGNSGNLIDIFGNGLEDSMKPKKKVSILPPPLNVGLPRSGRKEHIPTPYPDVFRKSYTRRSQAGKHPAQKKSILVLSLRRHPDRRPQHITELRIPANFDISTAVKIPESPHAKERQTAKHFETLDFDDAHFFRELRRAYVHLAGPFRFFSARTLCRIELSHSGSCTSCRCSDQSSSAHACGIPFPRSPRLLVSQGLADSFSEANLMEQFRNPKSGKAQYMWVHWAHRISTTPLHLHPRAPTPPTDSHGERATGLFGQAKAGHHDADCVAGLDFVERWSLWRMAWALAMAVGFAVAAAVLWIVLGVSPDLMHAGFRNAGDRVAAGCLLGVFSLLVGLVGVAGWVGVSWLVD